jgi:hypothetical protein
VASAFFISLIVGHFSIVTSFAMIEFVVFLKKEAKK